MDINNMTAGRETDYIIGRDVMGFDFSQMPERHDYYWDGAMLEVPHYSTDIAAAWEVVEKLGLGIIPAGLGIDGKPCYWYAGLPYIKKSGEQISIRDTNNPTMGHAETAPLAICHAAMKIVVAR